MFLSMPSDIHGSHIYNSHNTIRLTRHHACLPRLHQYQLHFSPIIFSTFATILYPCSSFNLTMLLSIRCFSTLILIYMASMPLEALSFAPYYGKIIISRKEFRPRASSIGIGVPNMGISSGLAEAAAEDEKETHKRPSFPKLRRRSRSLITEVVTLSEYKAVVVEESNRMVVVRFYAPWCRSCKAVEPMFERMAEEYSPHVKFVQVPMTRQNAFLHEGLGVPSFPWAHIYHPEAGLVEERKVNKKVANEFQEVLDTYVQGYCVVLQEEAQKQS